MVYGMGTEVEAFLGPVTVLRGWRSRIPGALVFALKPEVGLTPITGEFIRDLRLGWAARDLADRDIIAQWGKEASRGCTIIWYREYEHGDSGDRRLEAWEDGQILPNSQASEDALFKLGIAEPDLHRYSKTELWAAAAVLEELAERGREGLQKALRHPSEQVRMLAVDTCGEQQGFAALLIEMATSDPAPAVRLKASSALGRLGPEGVEALRTVLATTSPTDPSGALFAIGEVGAAASAAVPDVVKVLRSASDSAHRREAAQSLGKIGPGAAQAVPALIQAMQDADPFVRHSAVVALGLIGPAAHEAIPRLRQALDDPYREIPWTAIVSLGQVGPFPSREVINALQTNPSWVVRCEAAKALAKQGCDAPEAISALTDALTDQDHLVRANAAQALGALGGAARSALPALRQCLADPRLRKWAAEALDRIGE